MYIYIYGILPSCTRTNSSNEKFPTSLEYTLRYQSNMKFQNFTTLALGLCSFFGLTVSSINADDSIRQSESTDGPTNKVQQFHPRRPRAGVNVIGGDDDYSIKAATVVASPAEEHPRNLKKRAPWTAEEETLLLELRDQRGLPWDEIREFFPERSWVALRAKYQDLTEEADGKKENLGYWTEEEKTLLVELVDANIPWEDIAKRFPERSIQALREQYNFSTRGGRVADGGAFRQWTPEENELLLRLAEEDIPWEEKAAFFDNRSLAALKQRYIAISTSS